MAKKKFRDIVVDGVKYAWGVKSSWYSGSLLRIWKDKKVIIEESCYRGSGMKPSMVAEKIKEYEAKH